MSLFPSLGYRSCGDFPNSRFAARMKSEATYEAPGPEGYGIPAGTYRIAIICKPRPGTAKPSEAKGKRPNAPDRDEDYLKDQFGPESSPIIRTVDSSCHLSINKDQPSESSQQSPGRQTLPANENWESLTEIHLFSDPE